MNKEAPPTIANRWQEPTQSTTSLAITSHGTLHVIMLLHVIVHLFSRILHHRFLHGIIHGLHVTRQHTRTDPMPRRSAWNAIQAPAF